MNYFLIFVMFETVRSGPVDDLSDQEKKFATAGKSACTSARDMCECMCMCSMCKCKINGLF